MNLSERKILEATAKGLAVLYPASSFVSPSFFSHAHAEDFPSFSKLFFEAGREEVKTIERTLSYIVSILHRPHLSQKDVVTLLESGQVSRYDEDMMQESAKDASLWSKKEHASPYPKEIYCRQDDDNYCIYENFFVTTMIDLLAGEVVKELNLTAHFLKTTEDGSLSLPNDDATQFYLVLKRLQNKIQHVQDTSFYKLVRKKRPTIARYEATNILIHDPLYHEVYKDYLKRIAVVPEKETNTLIASLWMPTMFYSLSQEGYELDPKASSYEKGTFVFSKPKQCRMVFQKQDNHYDVEVTCFLLPVQENQETYHLIFENEKNESVISLPSHTLRMTLFSLSYGKEKHYDADSLALMNQLVTLLYWTKEADPKVYTRVCPNCLSSSVQREKEHYRCSSCHTEYSFLPSKDGSIPMVWIRNKE